MIEKNIFVVINLIIVTLILVYTVLNKIFDFSELNSRISVLETKFEDWHQERNEKKFGYHPFSE
jgi:hypothetical protein